MKERKIAKISYMNKKSLPYEVASILMTFCTYGDMDNYIILEDVSKAITIYPEEVEENVIRCTMDQLKDEVKVALFNKHKHFIIINNFQLTFDYIKDELFPLIEQDGCIIINNIVKKDMNEQKTCIYLDEKFLTAEDEWDDIREHMEKIVKTDEIAEDDDEYDEDLEHELYLQDILCDDMEDMDIELDLLKEYVTDLFNDDIIAESYTYKSNDNELKIGVTTEDQIIISDSYQAIVINKNQYNFLIDSLKQLIDN